MMGRSSRRARRRKERSRSNRNRRREGRIRILRRRFQSRSGSARRRPRQRGWREELDNEESAFEPPCGLPVDASPGYGLSTSAVPVWLEHGTGGDVARHGVMSGFKRQATRRMETERMEMLSRAIVGWRAKSNSNSEIPGGLPLPLMTFRASMPTRNKQRQNQGQRQKQKRIPYGNDRKKSKCNGTISQIQ